MKITLSKVKNKINRIFKNVVYHNYRYKPSGIYPTSKIYVEEEAVKGRTVFYKEIYTHLVSNLAISKELYGACSHYFKPTQEVATTYLVVAVPGGRVHTDNATSIAVISADNRLIGDVSFSYNYGRTIEPTQNNIFSQKYFEKPLQVKGKVFTMLTGGSGTHNYSHWLIDVLPRIHLLKQSGLYHQIDWFLVPSYQQDFQRDTLAMLGIGPDKILEGDKYPHVQADTIIASTAPRGNDSIIPYWLCDFLKTAFLSQATLMSAYPPFIYLSRKDSRFRVVANEDDLTLLLDKYGFKTFVLSELSFKQKIDLFAGAQIIISATGAGMTNMVFCKKGTKIIELFNEGFVVGPFYDMAPKLDLDYRYIISKTGSKAKNLKQGQEEDLVVDLHQVEKMMNTIFSSTNTFPVN